MLDFYPSVQHPIIPFNPDSSTIQLSVSQHSDGCNHLCQLCCPELTVSFLYSWNSPLHARFGLVSFSSRASAREISLNAKKAWRDCCQQQLHISDVKTRGRRRQRVPLSVWVNDGSLSRWFYWLRGWVGPLICALWLTHLSADWQEWRSHGKTKSKWWVENWRSLSSMTQIRKTAASKHVEGLKLIFFQVRRSVSSVWFNTRFLTNICQWGAYFSI